MKKIFFLKNSSHCFTVTAVIFLLHSCQPASKKYDEKRILIQIAEKMREQENCWNNGDIPCFMQHYWHSDSLLFVGKNGPTYGWKKTLERYLKAYPNQETMGKLTFVNKQMKFLDQQTIQVIGSWQLSRSDMLQDLSGYYSLLWQPKQEQWVIISDHSS